MYRKPVREKQLVQNADDMNSDDFNMHMTVRHPDSLGDMTEIIHVSQYVEDCWRSFHDRLHGIRFDFQHEHADPR